MTDVPDGIAYTWEEQPVVITPEAVWICGDCGAPSVGLPWECQACGAGAGGASEGDVIEVPRGCISPVEEEACKSERVKSAEKSGAFAASISR
jgi:hypothetical protein